MTMHGGGFAQLATADAPRAPGRPAAAPIVARRAPPDSWSGFRHFPREPRAEERSAWRFDPAAPDQHPRIRDVLARLAKRMRAERWPGDGARDNPDIPAGYTYLLQLMAHDLVQSSLPASLLQGNPLGLSNSRGARLRLDTIYGGGPNVTPLAYAIDDPQDQSRRKLRLGRMGADPAAPGAACPFRDIARVALGDASGCARSGLTEALVADPRNDDHAIIAQLTAVFHHLHNRVVDLLPMAPPGAPAAFQQSAALSFLCAREASTLIYRRIIRDDLLPRILDPAVLAYYEIAGAPGLVSTGAGVPLEFSHGAFRFGHAMVRPGYVIHAGAAEQTLDDTLRRTSTHDPDHMPLDPGWIVQWSRFFALDRAAPNASQRIGPQFSAGLDSEDFFPAVDDSEMLGLCYRDLVSAAAVGLWSVEAMAREIGLRQPALLRAVPQLSDAAARAAALRDWLRAAPEYGALGDDDAAALAADPPLPFFVLFEAAQAHDGRRLGPLGSIIVADVVLGALAATPMRRERPGNTLRDALRELSEEVYGEAKLGDVPEIASMADLVRFVAEGEEVKAAVPPAFV